MLRKKFWAAIFAFLSGSQSLLTGRLVRAEEDSILIGAQVNEEYLDNPDKYPGNDLIGPGFKNFV